MSKIIQEIEAAQIKKDIPTFKVGDTLVVQSKVKEGTRERLQTFEGIVIAKRNRGLHSAFTLRKVSHGEGVERVFQTHSPLIESIQVKRRGDVRKAKLYHLRELSGRAARIKEKIQPKTEKTKEASLAKVEKGEAEEPIVTSLEIPEETPDETAIEIPIETAEEERTETE